MRTIFCIILIASAMRTSLLQEANVQWSFYTFEHHMSKWLIKFLRNIGQWGASDPHWSTVHHISSQKLHWRPGSLFTMMTSSNGNIFRVTGHLCGEFTGPRWIPHTKASDAALWCFFDLRLNKRLSKQSWGWWFGTLSRPLWRQCNVSSKPSHLKISWCLKAARFGFRLF